MKACCSHHVLVSDPWLSLAFLQEQVTAGSEADLNHMVMLSKPDRGGVNTTNGWSIGVWCWAPLQSSLVQWDHTICWWQDDVRPFFHFRSSSREVLSAVPVQFLPSPVQACADVHQEACVSVNVWNDEPPPPVLLLLFQLIQARPGIKKVWRELKAELFLLKVGQELLIFSQAHVSFHDTSL